MYCCDIVYTCTPPPYCRLGVYFIRMTCKLTTVASFAFVLTIRPFVSAVQAALSVRQLVGKVLWFWENE